MRFTICQHCGTDPATAHIGGGCHATYSPGAWLAVGCDEADGDQCSALEGADRECAGGLVAGQALDRFVRAQNRLAERSSVSKRNLAHEHVCHDTNARVCCHSVCGGDTGRRYPYHDRVTEAAMEDRKRKGYF
jgi:hypothetical protein